MFDFVKRLFGVKQEPQEPDPPFDMVPFLKPLPPEEEARWKANMKSQIGQLESGK